MTTEAFQHELMSFSRKGGALLQRGTDQQALMARHVYHVSGRTARTLWLLPGKIGTIKALGHLDRSSMMEMMPVKTTPPTLRRQPSISWRLNDLSRVLPFTATEIVEPVGTRSAPSMSTQVTLPKNPWGTSWLFI